jgi:predicted nucleic acid-binding protein
LKPEEYFLDVNIVIYAAGKPNEYKEPCVKVLRNVKARNLHVAIDPEIVQELLYRYHRIGLCDEAIELAWYLLKLKPRVLPISRKDLESSLQFYHKYSTKGVPPRDTIHLAAMLNNGIRKIITADRHFGEIITEVERIDPKKIT